MEQILTELMQLTWYQHTLLMFAVGFILAIGFVAGKQVGKISWAIFVWTLEVFLALFAVAIALCIGLFIKLLCACKVKVMDSKKTNGLWKEVLMFLDLAPQPKYSENQRKLLPLSACMKVEKIGGKPKKPAKKAPKKKRGTKPKKMA